MSGHSPGPWYWTDDNGVSCSPQWRLAPGILLSDGLSGTPGGDSIDRANARLIAAAPDMAEALREMFVDGAVRVAFAGNPVACDRLETKVRAALAKAGVTA